MRPARDEEFVAFAAPRLPALQRFAFRLCGSDDRADDLLQESLTKLYTRWYSVRDVVNLDAYVRTVIVRVYIDETRRPWFRVRLFGAVPDQTAAPTPEPEDRQVVRAALDSLPAGQRAVLILRFICDLPITEVAELLSCSEGTVRSQTSRGVAKLRQTLARTDFAVTVKEG